MYHLRKIKVLLATCLLACSSLWAQDTEITIKSATADSYHNDDHRVANAIDGNFETIWHSNWNNIPSFPVNFVITLEKVSHVDYVRYTPRLSGTNGNWKVVDVSYSTSTSGSSFTSPVTYDLKGASSTFDFPIGANCGQIKFTIYPGETDNGKNLASAAEIAAYAYDTAKPAAFAEYFNGDVYSELKPGVTSSDGIADADVKALVAAMLADAEDYKKFRVGEYEPYMTTATVRNNLKTNSLYNNYENPTGIYLKRGESCIIAVSGIGNYPVGLKIKDWYKSGDLSTYKLHNGLNYITATTEGNVFVDYYTDDFKNAPNVQMHFINAPVLGYWDQATMTNADWVSMLAGPLAEDDVIIITRSEHAQVAYPVKQWKTYCPTDVNSTMTFYQQVQWAERDMLGLEMFDRQVKNRQLFCADKSGSMYAGGDASYCGYGDLRTLVIPDAKNFDFWGVGHEWGHNNQMPGFHWSGCGETTNNIPAAWAQFKFTGNRDANGNPTYLRLEDEVTGVDDYSGMRGGRMQVYFEEGLRKGVQWQLQEGPDFYKETPKEVTVTEIDADGNSLGQVTVKKRNYDHFVKVVPLWQLNMWGIMAEKSPYIIPKVLERIRLTEDYTATYNTNGKQQINWMKLACDVAKTDLLPFFEKAGMLRPIHAYIEDYGAGWNIITEEMINDLKDFVAAEVDAGRYQAYPDEEINYINAHNYHIYRDNLELNVTAMEGERNGDKVTIQHSVAQNAVAFETYNAQDELIRITMYGLGSNDEHSYTQVLYPESLDKKENAAYIMAVGYDGERQRVYQTYDDKDEAKYVELGRLLAGVEEALTLPSDETNTKVGYCNPSALTDLNAAYVAAKEVYDNKKTTYYVATYDKLYAEYEKVLNTRVGIVEGNAYRLTNKHKDYTNRAMSVAWMLQKTEGEGEDAVDVYNWMIVGETAALNDAQKWYFEASGTEGCYYIKNKSTKTYPGNVETSTKLFADKTTSSKAHAYKLQDMGNGLWALVGSTGLHQGSSVYDYGIVGWTADADASQWYITAVEINSNAEALHELKSLIEKTEALIAEVEGDDVYSSIATALSQAKSQVADAKAALEEGNSSAYDALNEKYTALHEAALNVLKNQLSTLMTSTSDLIAQCGEVIYTEAAPDTELELQADNSANSWYVSSNADHNTGTADPDGGGIFALVDNDNKTYFHTRWGGGEIKEPHYIQVDMGVGITIKDFVFSYIARNNSPAPTKMTISGSNNGSDFDDIASITKDWADYNNDGIYTSDVIAPTIGYRYLRFTVTESNGPGDEQYGGQYFFGMKEFDITEKAKPESYEVNLGAAAGDVTEDMLLAAFKQNQEAQVSYEMATTEAQLQMAIAALQAQYDALSEAKAAVRYQSYYVQVVGTRYINNDFGVTYQGEKYHHGYIFDAPTTLEANQLKEINETASHQLVSIVVEDGVITVTYIPLYVVTVYGVSDMGGVNYGGVDYGNGDVFPASSLEGLEAINIPGYEVEMIVNEMYINVSYYKNYTITIEGVSNNESERVCVQYNSEEYENGNVIRTLGEIDENYLTLVAPHYYAVERFNVDHDASRIIVEFINKSYLNTLIGETTNMLADCDAYNYVFAEVENARTAVDAANTLYWESLVSADDYRIALSNLQSAKEALANAIQTESSNRQASREALNSLIDDASSLIADCAENPGDATDALIEEVNVVVTSAQAVANNMGSTVDELVAATEALQAKYDVLDAAQQSTAKADLRALIAQAEVLIAECGKYGYGVNMVETPVDLQVKDENAAYYLSTNADQNVVGNSKDGDGIAALIDGNVRSYMHTQWSGTAVGEAHYIQVNLGGQGLAEFTFTYATRYLDNAYYNSPAPAVIEVYGCNSKSSTKLATFPSDDSDNALPLYTEPGKYWTSATITSNADYEYIRFYVRDSRGPAENTTYEGYHYFAMSEFALKSISSETNYYVESLTSYGNVTEEQFLNVVLAMKEAEALAENSYDKAELEAAAATLQSVYDVLVVAHNDYSYLPVTLTTDVENPTLYTINSKRGSSDKPKVLQYAPAEGHMFTIVDATAEVSAKQLFYFTKGTEKGQVYVHPFAAAEQVLASNDISNGAAKVFVKEKNVSEAIQWTIEEDFVADAVWYSLKAVGTDAYFSNFGGIARKMGFLDSKDDGSRITFAPASIEGSAAYHTLKVYLDEAVKDVSSNNPGYYRGTDAHVSAYEKAIEVLDNQSSDDADYLNAYNTLLSVNESLEMILPEVGKFYVIRSAHDGYAKDALVYANLDDNKMRWGSKELTDATAIWTIVPAGDGAYHICNLHTGTYINGVNETLNETAGNITLESLSVNGQFGFHSSGMMHAQSGGAIVNYTTSANGASAWRIEEVGHAAKIGDYLHTSLYLDYPTIIPEGVKAYIAKNPIANNPSEKGTIDLVKLQGNVLPANTGVILYSETPDTYYFLYTDAEATDDVKSENLLRGSASEQYVGDETGAKKYYIFGRKDENVGLYWARMDYTADGTYVGNDEGTHFKASANKVYLELDASQPALSGFRFRVGDEETGIKNVVIDADATIYDLYGRRVLEVVTPGLYIINGEKRYINIK